MRPGTARDRSDTDYLHKSNKRLVKRVEALEGMGTPEGANASLQALEARLDRMASSAKERDRALRDQIASLRGTVLALSNEVKRLKADV